MKKKETDCCQEHSYDCLLFFFGCCILLLSNAQFLTDKKKALKQIVCLTTKTPKTMLDESFPFWGFHFVLSFQKQAGKKTEKQTQTLIECKKNMNIEWFPFFFFF